MNIKSLKNILTKPFFRKKDTQACTCSVHQGLSGIQSTFAEMHKSVDSISNSLNNIIDYQRKTKELFKIEARISEISAIATSPTFADMVLNRPNEVKSLRDELDSLVLKSRNL